MAETAGLAIGAAALIGTFKDCIDVYGMIVSARSLTDDAEVLNTKLDVERMLLLQWADRIGMTEPEDYDRRLDDPDLNHTIARVLESIKGLLSDGKALRDRYGLVDYQAVRHKIVFDDRLGTTAGSTRLKQFIERFNKLSLHTGEPRKDQSVITRFKWVVKDKEKFASLVDELSYFVSRLDALIPAPEQSFGKMTEQDLAQINSIPQLKAIFDACIGSRPQIDFVAQQALRFINQERILNCLWFRWIDNRKTSISERHSRTLEWALETSERDFKWDNLAEWLKNGNGLYWLAGKPGSGKSTLMKYISDHPRTNSLLSEWAEQSELVSLQFFFYALGRPEQKSQEGILRSLLFQFLDKYRKLIEQILPAMWKEAIITKDEAHPLALPSISEMQASLLHLAETVSADKKIWMLIDGLDEFQGKHATIAAFLSKLQRLPNVKIMVSSRPLQVFVSRFEHAPKMYLQDLTTQDIETYIDDTIAHHPHMARISKVEPGVATKIVMLMIRKASGVFLWVVLACRSILEGLDDHETGSELMSRTSELPPELGDFFRQIIEGVDPRKRDQCVRLLRLVFESQKCPRAEPIPAIGLTIIDEQGLRADFMGPSVTRLSHEQLMLRCQALEGRLRSRCSGLVELAENKCFNFYQYVGNARMTYADEHLINCPVQFMHRSLYEFFCTEGMWEWDVLRVDNSCGFFEPHVILASLWTQLAGLHVWGKNNHKETCFDNAFIHNAYAEVARCPPRFLARNLSRLQGLFSGEMCVRARGLARLCLVHQSNCRKGYEDPSVVLAFAAELGMVSLVRLARETPGELRRTLITPEANHVHDCSSFSACATGLYKLNRDRAGSKHTNRSTTFPLLYHATCRPSLTLLQHSLFGDGFYLIESILAPTEAVEYLLKQGHDPNEAFFTNEDEQSTTPWIEWLKAIRAGSLRVKYDKPTRSESGIERAHQLAVIALLLVDSGAKLGAPGTEMCMLIDEGLSEYILNAAQRRGKKSVKLARSDDLWLKVRDRIQSLRTAASQQDAHSR